MKISKELFDKIHDCIPQIEHKFGIGFGYSCQYACFVRENDRFILYEADNEDLFIVENNIFQQTWEGIGVSFDGIEFEALSERISDFLIDFHEWLKKGLVVLYAKALYKHWKWKPLGDGRYSVERVEGHWTSIYSAFLYEFEEQDFELRDHIQKVKHEMS